MKLHSTKFSTAQSNEGVGIGEGDNFERAATEWGRLGESRVRVIV